MKVNQKTKNPYAKAFYEFCLANPELRFWQAVRAFTGANYVLVSESLERKGVDTYYWEGINEISEY